MKSSSLDRFLRVFTDVRDGEGVTALLMFANVFLILCAYYFIKPLREGWIAVSAIEGLTKAEVKAYSSFLQSVMLIPIVWLFGRLSSRWSRSKLITRATLFCMSNMAIFWVLQPRFFFETLPIAGIVFYLWVGMFGVFVVAQFWAFAADVYTDEHGKRLLPMIAIGATAGAAVGSWIAAQLSGAVSARDAGGGDGFTEWLLVVAMIPLGASIFLTRRVDERERPGGSEQRAVPPDQDSGRSGITLVFASRLLIAIAIITLLLNWVNTNGENLLFWVVQDRLTEQAVVAGITQPDPLLLFTRDGTTAFYGNFYFLVNIAALVLQAFVASRLLKYGGFSAIFLMLPVVALVSYSAMALIPVLAIVKLMKVAENATDYSINNTARHVLFLPLSAEMKYKGKPAVDTFFVRTGDGLAALTMLIGVQLLDLSPDPFFVLNVGLVVLWLGLAFIVIREHRRASERAAARDAEPGVEEALRA